MNEWMNECMYECMYVYIHVYMYTCMYLYLWYKPQLTQLPSPKKFTSMRLPFRPSETHRTDEVRRGAALRFPAASRPASANTSCHEAMECYRENLERCQEKCWFKPMEVGSVPSKNVGLIYFKQNDVTIKHDDFTWSNFGEKKHVTTKKMMIQYKLGKIKSLPVNSCDLTCGNWELTCDVLTSRNRQRSYHMNGSYPSQWVVPSQNSIGYRMGPPVMFVGL